jgi:hypothetical protein
MEITSKNTDIGSHNAVSKYFSILYEYRHEMMIAK